MTLASSEAEAALPALSHPPASPEALPVPIGNVPVPQNKTPAAAQVIGHQVVVLSCCM